MLSTEYTEVLIEDKRGNIIKKNLYQLQSQINNFKLEDLTMFMESTDQRRFGII